MAAPTRSRSEVLRRGYKAGRTTRARVEVREARILAAPHHALDREFERALERDDARDRRAA